MAGYRIKCLRHFQPCRLKKILISARELLFPRENSCSPRKKSLSPRNRKISPRIMYCHSRGTIVAQAWHDIATPVARSFHISATNVPRLCDDLIRGGIYFCSEDIYFLRQDVGFCCRRTFLFLVAVRSFPWRCRTFCRLRSACLCSCRNAFLHDLQSNQFAKTHIRVDFMYDFRIFSCKRRAKISIFAISK